MGTWLYGNQTAEVNHPDPPAARLRVQSSAQGNPRPLACGKVRIASNLIWYGGFYVDVRQTSSGGGGGGKGAPSAPEQTQTTYNYYAYVAMGICAGPIASIDVIYDSRGGAGTLAQWSATAFLGAYDQSAWGYLTTNFPDQALSYRGLAYAAFTPMALGSSPDMPNLTFEITGNLSYALAGIPDANPRDWIAYLLTDAHEGIGFPADSLAPNTLFSNYALATGLLISQALTQQQSAQQVLMDLAQATNSDFRWSGGMLEIIPYGEEAITRGNIAQAVQTETIADPYTVAVDHAATFVTDGGVHYTVGGAALTRVTGTPEAGEYAVDESTGVYTFAVADDGLSIDIAYSWASVASFVPAINPVFDLVDDDYLPGDSGPIEVTRKPRADVVNTVKLEYLDRDNNYDPVAIDVKDEAAIQTYGSKTSDLRSMHMLALADAATLSASLMLNREQVVATYKFTLPPWAILADVMDILTVSRTPMNMLREGIRIVEIEEDEDGSLEFICEEYLGTCAAPIYGRQATEGYSRDLNESPGALNEPLFFEPTAELLGGADLQVWAAVSGVDTTKWGGCNVYVSFDGDTYVNMGQVVGPARMGVLTAELPPIAENPTGPTIDEVNTLAVDLSESGATLLSGTQADVLALATACYVDGEIVAYRDAALTTANNYDLTYLNRGVFGSDDAMAVAHPIGSRFARLDAGIMKVPFDQSRIGSTIYIKFQSFNQFGGGLDDLAELTAYPYVITGVALKSPLSQVQNVRAVFEAGFEKIYWDDVADFRTGIRYRIYKGDTFAGAQQVGDVAHAPFIAFGNGTYWISAYCQPVPALFVYSEIPASITVAGNMLVQNLVYSSDQQAAGWLGIFSNGVGRDGQNIRLGGGGDILTAPDFLNIADVLNYGGIIAEGTYEIRPQDYVNVGYLADCYINASWQCAGSPVGQDVLTVEDFLNMPDVLGSASTQYVNVKVQIATAQSPEEGDLYDAGDLYGVSPDLYYYGVQWSEWQDFVPGVYRAWLVKFRLVLTTVDANTICLALAFAYQVSVAPRIDHYNNRSPLAAGETITFTPDDSATASPFNGGPPQGGDGNQALPFVSFSWSNNPGVTPVIDSLDLASLTYHFEDTSGIPVAVTDVNVAVEGY